MKRISVILVLLCSCAIARAELSVQFGNSMDAYNIPTYETMGGMTGYNNMVNTVVGKIDESDFEPSYMKDSEKVHWYEKMGRNAEEGKGPVLKLFGIPTGGY